MAEVILDASALLAVFNGEPGREKVALMADRSQVSAVNLAEVISKLVQLGWSVPRATAAVGTLFCEIVPADEDGAIRAGLLHASMRGRNVSLADSFCLSLAKEHGLPVLTADRAWATLGLGVEVTLIR